MIIRKLIEVKVEGNIETTTKELLEVPEEESKRIIEFCEEIIENDNDYESSYSKGISLDFLDNIAWINFDSLSDYIRDRQIDLFDEGEQDGYEYEENKNMLPIINKYKGYIF